MRSIGPMSMTVIMASFMTKPAVAEATLPDACKVWVSAQQTAQAPADCAKALKMPGLNSENPNVFWGLAVAAGAGLAVGVTTGYWVKGLEKEHKRLSK